MMNSNSKIHKAHNTLLMIAMFSVIMLFAGLTSAYIVSKGALGMNWDAISLPVPFYISTVIILLSSVCAQLVVQHVKANNFDMIKLYLLCTLLLGFSFFLSQFFGWKSLVNLGKFLSGNNVASSYLYVFTIAHMLHLIGGLIFVIISFFNSSYKYYNSDNLHGIKLIVKFWHFLGVLWIYLFLFLLFIN